MSTTPFERLLEDVLREELLARGLTYDDVVESIIPQRDGEGYSIRFRGSRHDLELVAPPGSQSREALAALLTRKLESAFRRS